MLSISNLSECDEHTLDERNLIREHIFELNASSSLGFIFSTTDADGAIYQDCTRILSCEAFALWAKKGDAAVLVCKEPDSIFQLKSSV
jgi:hypothetical protein